MSTENELSEKAFQLCSKFLCGEWKDRNNFKGEIFRLLMRITAAVFSGNAERRTHKQALHLQHTKFRRKDQKSCAQNLWFDHAGIYLFVAQENLS